MSLVDQQHVRWGCAAASAGGPRRSIWACGSQGACCAQLERCTKSESSHASSLAAGPCAPHSLPRIAADLPAARLAGRERQDLPGAGGAGHSTRGMSMAGSTAFAFHFVLPGLGQRSPPRPDLHPIRACRWLPCPLLPSTWPRRCPRCVLPTRPSASRTRWGWRAGCWDYGGWAAKPMRHRHPSLLPGVMQPSYQTPSAPLPAGGGERGHRRRPRGA